MTPNAWARCFGQTLHEICQQRETCHRFRSLGANLAWVEFVRPSIPGPCAHFLVYEEPAAEPPSEASEEVPPPNLLPRNNGVNDGKT